jgi:hypothetical protein
MAYKPYRRRSNGGGHAFSMIRSQRGVNTTIVGSENEAEDVSCVDTRTDQRLSITETQAYIAVSNSFCPLNGKSHSEVARELLNQGVILSNSKGLFWRQDRWQARKQAIQTRKLRMAA